MEISGRRMRRFRMRFRRDHLTGGENIENEASCCYCDLKISNFNEPIFRLGRRFSGVLKVWFSIGLGFGVASLILVTVFLLLQFHSNPLFSNRLTSAVFGFSPSTVSSLKQKSQLVKIRNKANYFDFAACIIIRHCLCTCLHCHYSFSS